MVSRLIWSEIGYRLLSVVYQMLSSTCKLTTFELRFSSCQQYPEVKAMCCAIHLLYFLAQLSTTVTKAVFAPSSSIIVWGVGLKRNSKVVYYWFGGQAGCPAGGKTSCHQGIWCTSYSLSIPGVVITAINLSGLLDRRSLHMASPALLCPQQHLLVVSLCSLSLLCGAIEFPAVYRGGQTGLVSLGWQPV